MTPSARASSSNHYVQDYSVPVAGARPGGKRRFLNLKSPFRKSPSNRVPPRQGSRRSLTSWIRSWRGNKQQASRPHDNPTPLATGKGRPATPNQVQAHPSRSTNSQRPSLDAQARELAHSNTSNSSIQPGILLFPEGSQRSPEGTMGSRRRGKDL